jgi:hypothetical protein
LPSLDGGVGRFLPGRPARDVQPVGGHVAQRIGQIGAQVLAAGRGNLPSFSYSQLFIEDSLIH